MSTPVGGNIEESVTVGQTPPMPGDILPSAGTTSVLQAHIDQEYVAAGKRTWFMAGAESLPWGIDDLSRDLGDDLYERMLYDPQVAAAIGLFRAAILETGVTLTSAVADETADGYDQADEIADWCERVLDDLDTDLDAVLWDMLECVALGNRVAEQVYDLDMTYTGRSQLVLRKLKVKPRKSLAFVVDTYMNVLGFMALIPGQATTIQVGTAVTDLGAYPNILPRHKFAVATFRPRNHDPRGTSILRPAYNAWWLKMQAWPEYLKYLTQFASPSLIGFTGEKAQPYRDAAGTLVTPEQAMVNALVTFRNGTALAFPFGATVQPIIPQGTSSSVFLDAFRLYDQQIVKAILTQTLATGEGEHQARAAAEVHQDVLGTLVMQAKKAVQRMLRRDVLMPLVRYNYGDQAVALTPHVSLGETEKQDVATLATAIAKLETAGFVAPSQRMFLDTLLGWPQRTPEEVASGETRVASDQAQPEEQGQGGDMPMDGMQGGQDMGDMMDGEMQDSGEMPMDGKRGATR